MNLAAVYTQVGTDDEWLSSATSMAFTRVVGFAETAAFVLLAFTVYTICRHGAVSPLPGRGAARGRSLRLPGAELSAPAPQPRWTAREVLALLALTAATAALSFAYLGDLTAPQHPMESAGTTRTETITPAADADETVALPGHQHGRPGSRWPTPRATCCMRKSSTRAPASAGAGRRAPRPRAKR